MPEPAEVGGGGETEGRKSIEFDLDSSWPLDQISFISPYPVSPFPISSPNEQPCSPLWAFSDDDRLLVADGGGQASSAFDGGLRLPDHPIPLTCNPNSETGSKGENDDNSKLPSPFFGINSY
ncbi:hypothetical protein OIU77_022857 [Salix suchowensis]|uniref:Uncharacterized protein n=1 Tax=Salix suchowensis TaxID=1278906 RepID=A0ABQ9C1U7_9ROSI|nr:hypothetical protein OIU77_022857 [Salix suchowensis]